MSDIRKLIDLDTEVVKILTKEAVDSGSNFKNWTEGVLQYLAFHSRHNEGQIDLVGNPGGIVELSKKIAVKKSN